ncbi:polyprenyl synthetase family protein [Anaerococcus tetradius]|uniref:Polyprenyl synthetase n=1 Tax=Anaerococcus tetradius TaxID=33036 RepID=A0A133KEW9_9FIRM|nr:polyprenyl synthetase family protein [Anaerococcus tetradius]KWZ78103.1 polyprenyl synthetase [Anaerococcus tetradius]
MNLQISDVLSKENLIEDLVIEIHQEIKNILGDYKSSQNLYDIIKDALRSSGKMIRTKLLICISLMGEEEISDKIISQCAAVEITHLASLIHDDIIDDSTLRRSHKSTQAKYGKDVAVFAGDYMIAKVFSYLAKKGYVEEISVIADTIRDMCNGEVGQNLNKYKINVSTDEYFENISGKTASFFKTVCYFGSKNCGFDRKDTEKMVRFGQNLGLMFQLKDDLLDLFSEKALTGKEEFSDLREGIYTYPIILALQDEEYGKDIYDILVKNRQTSLDKKDFLILRDLLKKARADFLSSMMIKKLADENRFILKSLVSGRSTYLYKILEKVEKF